MCIWIVFRRTFKCHVAQNSPFLGLPINLIFCQCYRTNILKTNKQTWNTKVTSAYCLAMTAAPLLFVLNYRTKYKFIVTSVTERTLVHLQQLNCCQKFTTLTTKPLPICKYLLYNMFMRTNQCKICIRVASRKSLNHLWLPFYKLSTHILCCGGASTARKFCSFY